MPLSFHNLATPGSVLISAFVGSGSEIFAAPPTGLDLGSAPMRPYKLCFAVTKATSISSASDYLKIDTSSDDGSTWNYLQEDASAADAFNFLTGKTGTSVSFEAVVWLAPGQKARLRASAGLTLAKVGFAY